MKTGLKFRNYSCPRDVKECNKNHETVQKKVKKDKAIPVTGRGGL
jgi:hypothetical protein